jgi:hypothetical protein
MTRKEMLLELVEQLPDDQVEAALVLLRQLKPEDALDSQPALRPLPAFVGMGRGPADLAERTEEYLAEDFGR